MLLSALRCTVAMICIKIVHVVKVLRVRVGGLQFGKPSLVQRNADMMSRNSNTNNKRSSENLRK
jgi:hypothetical protein